ncbi:type II toxin-antitoxin system RnlB family antitoxin [Clostridium sp.]|jgi:hypothetical protein|uniref:type II toxin-antitoxin system RnlB family antitoxin n=1 Tax=Clostridium sp. TaxID=1506 RepID=UPI00258FB3B1|nr:type II toxin-antitoxin system RnlB family antitoxin [Clostridium sp.]MDF2503865.1 hypothetical protein [Clostridium sp.]
MNINCKVYQCEFNQNQQCAKNKITIDFACDDYEYAYCTNYKESNKSIESHYNIQKLDNMQYDYIIFSKSIETVTDYLEHIIETIKEDKFTLIIDNLLHNGASSDSRYIEIKWNKSKSINENYKNVKFAEISKNSIFRELSTEYYKNNKNLIEHSILTSIQKKMILKGIVI